MIERIKQWFRPHDFHKTGEVIRSDRDEWPVRVCRNCGEELVVRDFFMPALPWSMRRNCPGKKS